MTAMFKDLRRKLHRHIMFIGIVVILAGFVASAIIGSFNEKAVETAASIVEITQPEEDSLLKKNEVFVEYIVDGETYRDELGYYEEDMIEGQTVMVKYDPEDPANMRPVDGPDTVRNIYITGGCIFAAGLLMSIGMSYRERKAADRRAEKRYERRNSR